MVHFSFKFGILASHLDGSCGCVGTFCKHVASSAGINGVAEL